MKNKYFYVDKQRKRLIVGKKSVEEVKKKNFYYNPLNMELNKKGYPIYKDSKKLVHRYIAEKYILKRELSEGEIVHHVDGDKLNYDFNNLIILDETDHIKLERNLRLLKNENIAQGIILVIVFAFFSGVGEEGFNLFGKLVIWFLLFIGIMIPYYPRLLRKVLFKLSILRKNKNK